MPSSKCKIFSAAILTGLLFATGCTSSPRPTTQQFALARYNPNGSLDKTFGTGGQVLTSLSAANNAQASALVSDPTTRKLVAAGDVWNSSVAQFGLARYNPNGTLDGSFGNGGRVLTVFPGVTGTQAPALAVDPATNKLVAAGTFTGNTIAGVVLSRYNADGSLDSAFGVNGRVVTTFPFRVGPPTPALAPEMATGRLVAAGFASTTSTGGGGFLLVRYNPNGTLDSTFGTNGRVITSFPGTSGAWVTALATDPTTNKLVAAGYAFASPNFLVQFALARYNPDGSLDLTFGNGGLVVTAFAGDAAAYALTSEPATGNIVAAGAAWTSSGEQFALARYNPDGSLDATFGTSGRVLTSFPGGLGAQANAVAADQATGKIVAAGFAMTTGMQFALARYNPNGGLDSSFGTGGTVVTFFPSTSWSSVFALASDPATGKLVAAGTAQ
jgi:uncharacterized delta-60 repeat protein